MGKRWRRDKTAWARQKLLDMRVGAVSVAQNNDAPQQVCEIRQKRVPPGKVRRPGPTEAPG